MVNLLHDVGHDLVVHVLVAVQVHLGVVRIVPNDFPGPKAYILTLEASQ